MLPLLSNLSPNTAVLTLTVGLALIALELNRPGSVFPGAIGLLLSLLAAASLGKHHPRPGAVLLSIGSMVLLLWQARRTFPWIVPAGATIFLILSMAMLLPSTAKLGVSPWVALLCGLIFGAGITVLTRIARRARRNKGLD
jgi:membrane-bound ClpP family serine protease